jgi:non-lysosomal glucosylceramidase
MDSALHEWDTDMDGMIENSGTCDQTYDAWKMFGVRCVCAHTSRTPVGVFSAYCGSLWLGALQACVRMAEHMGEPTQVQHYAQLLSSARHVFTEKLWTGDYYKFDERRTKRNDTIMADQLCGVWYAGACCLSDAELVRADCTCAHVTPRMFQLLPAQDVQRCLSTLFSNNVMGVRDGRMGLCLNDQ